MNVCLDCCVKFDNSLTSCPKCGKPVNTEIQQNIFNYVEPEEPISSSNGAGLAGLLLLLSSLLLFLVPILPKTVVITLLVICFVAGGVCTLIGCKKRPIAVAKVASCFYGMAIFAIIVLVVMNFWFPEKFNFSEYIEMLQTQVYR